jgi:CDP-glycerol glycerophosphotransferase (TagB/SpsB family)
MVRYLTSIQRGKTEITLPNYQNTHDLLSVVDAIVSPLSTILIEGAAHGKPVLCFLPGDVEKHSHFSRVLPLVHFQDYFNNPDFHIAMGEESLIGSVSELLEKVADPEYRARLKRATEFYVQTFDQPYSSRLLEYIDKNYVPLTCRR